MTAAIVYSSDDDLAPVYCPDPSSLPDDTGPLHAAAYAQLRRDLIAQGRSTYEVDDLTDGTLEALKAPACCYVMHLIFRGLASQSGAQAMLDLAKYWQEQYAAALASTPIASDYNGETDAEPPPAGSDRVWMG